jgi:leucyl-tRNA synthetase
VQEHADKGGVVELNTDDLSDELKAVRRQTYQTLSKVADDLGRRHTFNTAIAAVMELMNHLAKLDDDSEQGRAVMQEALEKAVLMLSPITPHICHELWKSLGHDDAVMLQAWPQVDESALVQDNIELMVQVNGKLRSKIAVAADADKEAIEAQALADENVKRYTDDKQIRKVIVVPGRLINIVVAG